MTTYGTANELLAETVRFAKKVEQLILRAHQAKPIGAVTYLVLVANRRLADAVSALGPERAYEGRVLIRSMLEHYFNLVWIRLRSPHRRANRFVKFLTIDRLRILENMAPDEQAKYKAIIATLRRRRAKYRHLFHATDKNGVRRWMRSWAGDLSFEARVAEIASARRPPSGAITKFSYTLYRWFSAATHGSVLHLEQLVEGTRYGGRPKRQPEFHPEAIPAGAATLLFGTLVQASQVLGFSAGMKDELKQLEVRFNEFIAVYSTA